MTCARGQTRVALTGQRIVFQQKTRIHLFHEGRHIKKYLCLVFPLDRPNELLELCRRKISSSDETGLIKEGIGIGTKEATNNRLDQSMIEI